MPPAISFYYCYILDKFGVGGICKISWLTLLFMIGLKLLIFWLRESIILGSVIMFAPIYPNLFKFRTEGSAWNYAWLLVGKLGREMWFCRAYDNEYYFGMFGWNLGSTFLDISTPFQNAYLCCFKTSYRTYSIGIWSIERLISLWLSLLFLRELFPL